VELAGVRAAFGEVQGEVEELAMEHSALRDKQQPQKAQALRNKLNALAAVLSEVLQAEAVRKMMQADCERIAAEAKEAGEASKVLARKVSVLNASTEVLGSRGARTLLLGRALHRLKQEANAALAALGMGLAVEVSGTSELKSGKEVAAISIEVKGAGGGNYRGLSSGERARVDVGLLLGLAELLEDGGEGWVAFDEVFDSLDAPGQEAVATYLDALGQTRQVLVISHHEDLRALFPRGQVLRAARQREGSTLEGTRPWPRI